MMQNCANIKFRKSSIIGVLIIYYVLMDSSFPFAEGGLMLDFFYWTKFALAVVVILYASFCVGKREKTLKKICKRIRLLFLTPWILMLFYSCIIWATQKNGNTLYY